MKYQIISNDVNFVDYDAVVVGIYEDKTLTASAQSIDELSQGYISKVLEKGDFKGKSAETLLLQDIADISRVILVGCGKQDSLDKDAYIKVLNAANGALKKLNVTNVFTALTELFDDSYQTARTLVESTENLAYSFDQLKAKKGEDKPEVALSFTVAEADQAETGVRHGQAIAAGMTICKDVMNLPPNICNPRYLATQATELAEKYDNVEVDIIGETQMEELAMSSYLAVGRGSANESVMSVIKYSGGATDEKPVVLVGKGLTFDSGGISIKPGAAMDEMKYDMGGAAGVLGAMRAISELQLPINVVGVLAGCENMPSGNAYRPGDILTSMSGKTIEVVNTDAEGRLVLCDALTYVERFEPKFVVDIATLTGACMVALGQRDTGLFTPNNDLSASILAAAEDTRDHTWRMPLDKSHKESLESPFADVCHMGGRFGGAITAAAFLWEFTDKYDWAHLDIAGTAWISGGKNKGATGRPVPLLTQLVLDQLA